MKTLEKVGAQGELFFVALGKLTQAERAALGAELGVDLGVDKLPASARVVQQGGTLIVGHSESGHHHVVRSPHATLLDTGNPFVCFLRLEAPAALEHEKHGDPHQHESWTLPAGEIVVSRQMESTPLGWRQVAD